MGNSLATLMIFAAPVIVWVLFRRLPLPYALSISIVGGYLILPVSPTFDLPFFPVYGKAMAVAVPALLIALLIIRRQKSPPKSGSAVENFHFQPGWVPQSPLIRLCFLGLLISPLLTALTNPDALIYPLRTIPRFAPYDAAAGIAGVIITLLPFLLARKFLARPEDQKTLLTVICVAALLYSLPTLWEARMSPQLNSKIYGFFPHDWRQHQRDGGYRPLVFLEHGLRLGLFLSIGILATAITARINTGRLGRIAAFGVFWLFVTIGMSKNLGALIIVVLLLPTALLLRPRGQALVAAVFAGIVLLYPMMRAANLVPITTITESIASVAEGERVRSLNFRLMNEDVLLERARERPLFGWGGWGRARVRDDLGRDISTTDGTWIIEFGESGWLGYLSRFGLLTFPILLLAFRRSPQGVPLATSGLALLTVANLIDLLPNSGLTAITWLMAGALAGGLETSAQRSQPGDPRGTTRHRRDHQRAPIGPRDKPALSRAQTRPGLRRGST